MIPLCADGTDGPHQKKNWLAEFTATRSANHLFESANASRQRYEGIRKLGHAMLALVHGLNRNKLRKAVMRALLCNHRARDDSDDLTPSGQPAANL
jgi:hypothetical protein